MSERYLVTAAAGSTGRATCRELLARGLTVRAFVRRDDGRARELRGAWRRGHRRLVDRHDRGAEGARRRPARVLHGAVHAVGARCSPGFATAAEEARLEAVVSMSQWLADPDPSAHTRRTWLADTAFGWMPSVANATINPGPPQTTTWLPSLRPLSWACWPCRWVRGACLALERRPRPRRGGASGRSRASPRPDLPTHRSSAAIAGSDRCVVRARPRSSGVVP